MKRRKNFLPALLLVFLFWLIFIYFIISFPPANSLLITLFFMLLFLPIFITLSLALGNSRRGLLLSLGFIIFLFLKQIQQVHALNIILLLSILLSIEIYFLKS